MPYSENGKPFTILSAEDDEDYYHLLKMILTRELKIERLDHVADGEELVNYMLDRTKQLNGSSPTWPDLVLLDLNMPKKTGLEALREIRTNPLIPSIPVVVFTVSSDLSDIEKCYNEGANAFITKPTELKELICTLQSAINYWKKKENLTFVT